MKGLQLANEIMALVAKHGDTEVVIDFRQWLPVEEVGEARILMAPDQMDWAQDQERAGFPKIRIVPVDYTENKRFTGLCGKGGVKIYEGDSCRWDRSFHRKLPDGMTEISTFSSLDGIIIFDRQRCAFGLHYKYGGKTYFMQLEATFSDGEIYQNDSIEVLT